MSSDGNTALVGAFADDGSVGERGCSRAPGGAWTEQAKLTAPTSGPDKEVGPGDFGGSVALSADGNTALIGGNGDAGSLGAAWVFTRSSTSWSERKKLIAPTTGPDAEDGNGEVGFSVSLSAAGTTAFLGAPTDNAGGFLGTGAVFVFTGSGASWSEQGELVAGGTSFEPNVGHSVATSSDGNTVVAGAPFRQRTDRRSRSGVCVHAHGR